MLQDREEKEEEQLPPVLRMIAHLPTEALEVSPTPPQLKIDLTHFQA